MSSDKYRQFRKSLPTEILCGVYSILCLPTNELYIGSSVDIFKRWRIHAFELLGISKRQHANYKLRIAVTRYGWDNLRFSILDICEREELESLETFYIKKFDTVDSGMNICTEGRTQKGKHLSATTKAKLAAAQRLVSFERRSAYLTGRACSAQGRANMSSAHKDKPLSEKHKRSIGLASAQWKRSTSHIAALAKGRTNFWAGLTTEERKGRMQLVRARKVA